MVSPAAISAGVQAGAGALSFLGDKLGLFGDGGEADRQRALDVWRKLQTSNFDYRSLDAPELRVLAQMSPEVYDAIVPAEVQTIAGSPEARGTQLRTLSKLERIGREGLPMEDLVATQEAQRAVADEAARARQDALRGLAARGQLGAGDELQARLAGNQQAAELARGQSADLTRLMALRRMAGLQGAADAAGRLRGQDVSQQAQNAQFVNRFNEMVARMQTQAARDAARARERAQEYNVQTRQRVGEQNPLLNYQTQLENLQRQNQLRQQQFEQDLAKTRGTSGTSFTLGEVKDREKTEDMSALQRGAQGVGDIAGSFFGS